MRRFWSKKTVSLRDRLLFTGVITTCLLLFVACTIILGSELLSFRQSLIDDLTGYAKTISSNSTAALSFDDAKSAEEILASMHSVPSIMGAIIYDRNGRVFARFVRDEKTWTVEDVSNRSNRYHFGPGHIDFYEPIEMDGTIIGSVYIRSDLARFYGRAARYGITLVIIMGLALFLSYVLFTNFHKNFTKRIANLLDVMYAVSKEKDYSVRARVSGEDELTHLADGFNEMLEKIHERDDELDRYRAHLEELVEERAAQLKAANKELQTELTERIRVEEALHESETHYRTIFETTGNANIIVENDMTVFMVNSAFERLSGYKREEVEGRMLWTDFAAEEDQERLRHYHYMRRIDPQSVPGEYECRVMDKDRNIKDIYLTEALIPGSDRSIASLLDITGRKRLEEQLTQSQKMEAIGQLAGGVAHDFNNILTAIIGYGSLLQEEVTQNERLKSYADFILLSADKARHLTQALLAFSRKQLMAPKPIDLNKVIGSMENLIVRLIGEDIKMSIIPSEKDVVVFADPGQVEQILMNLATNARDAMPDGGTFTIATDIATLDDDILRSFPQGQKEKKYASLMVSDTGTGIDKKSLEHIFEPFFTTKEVGKGTGLGLSIIHGIVNQNRGHITVSSESGIGTQFTIYLPLIELKAEETTQTPAPKLTGGRETILLAEDDDQIRGLIKEILGRYGYSVIEAADGNQAIDSFHRYAQDINLVILDVIMPYKNGKAVYDEIKASREDMKTLFISGYTADIIHKKGIFESNINFLSKPIIAGTLIPRVREILDGEGDKGGRV